MTSRPPTLSCSISGGGSSPASDCSNTGWQRDLSVPYDRIGDVLMVQGKLAEALKSYRDSLAIRERLAASSTIRSFVARSDQCRSRRKGRYAPPVHISS